MRYLFTSVIQKVSRHSDIIHISLWRSIQQYRSMYASIVEEVKVDVLHKKPFRIPVRQLHFFSGTQVIPPKHNIKLEKVNALWV